MRAYSCEQLEALGVLLFQSLRGNAGKYHVSGKPGECEPTMIDGYFNLTVVAADFLYYAEEKGYFGE